MRKCIGGCFFQVVEKYALANRLEPEFMINKILYSSSPVLNRVLMNFDREQSNLLCGQDIVAYLSP